MSWLAEGTVRFFKNMVWLLHGMNWLCKDAETFIKDMVSLFKDMFGLNGLGMLFGGGSPPG